MATERPQWDLMHVGGGTTLVVTYLSLIPGFLPSLLLLALLTAGVVLPMLLLGVAAALVVAPPYGLWRLTSRARRRRRRQADNTEWAARPLSVTPGVSKRSTLGSSNLPIHVQ